MNAFIMHIIVKSTLYLDIYILIIKGDASD